MNTDNPNDPQQPENAQDEDAIAFAEGIFDLARNGGATLLAPLLEAGVPVNMHTSNGETLLILATRNGHPETVRLLLAQGARPDQPDSRQRTPLMEAAMANRTDLLDSLLAAGADPGLTDGDGHTALDLARKNLAADTTYRLEQRN
ncbi:ankyrin repeat domain-containing protein [Marinobacter lacisalsi]|uniref:Ankyrin repeat domain-containing protein n=1 Tax=Marinobacter lacisalsi TaxID=475979 RepID=A0ABV8QF81_9GAMM